MPKLPVNRQSQRISQGTPVSAVSARGARRESEGLANLGGDLAKFGERALAYEARKQQVDDAQFRGRANAAAHLSAQQAEKEALQNPNAADDGSDLLQNYGSAFDKHVKLIDQIEDPREKAIAVEEALKVDLKYRASLQDKSIELHNGAVLRRQDKLKTELSQRVFNKPGEMFQALDEYDKTIPHLPYAKGTNATIQKEGKKDIVMAALAGLNEQADFKKVDAALASPEVSKHFSVRDLKALREDLYTKSTTRRNQAERLEAQKLARTERNRRNLEIRTSSDYLKRFSEAETVEQKAMVKESLLDDFQAGKLGPNAFSGLSNSSNRVIKEKSLRARADILTREMNGESIDALKADVMFRMGQDIDRVEAYETLKTLDKIAEEELDNPQYKIERASALQEIRNSVGFMQVDVSGRQILPKDKPVVEAQIHARFVELEREMPLQEAKRRAIDEYLGGGESIEIPGIPEKDVASLQRIKNTIIDNVKDAKINGRITPAQQLTQDRRINLIEMKIRAIQAAERNKEFLRAKPKSGASNGGN